MATKSNQCLACLVSPATIPRRRWRYIAKCARCSLPICQICIDRGTVYYDNNNPIFSGWYHSNCLRRYMVYYDFKRKKLFRKKRYTLSNLARR